MNNPLLEISKTISSTTNINTIISKIKSVFTPLQELNLFYYDYSTKKLKDVINNFSSVEEMYDKTAVETIYRKFLQLSKSDYSIDDKGRCILIPLKMSDTIYGMIELRYEFKPLNIEYLIDELIILSNILLLWIQNKLLDDRLRINSDFYDALKNIAKIIETQYELNYIIPLIGEMIDKFVSNHLIYIFLRKDLEYKLFWPNACRDKKIYDLLDKLSKKSGYIISDNRKIGVFPLINNGHLIGCIAAHSTIDELSPKEIEYINQLTKQSSATIERANSYAEVLQHATLDALTGLNNRHQFEIRLKQEYASSKRQNKPLCAMMLDIDFFKSINDTYGHATGDKVLKTVANVIKDKLREYDIPSRYGGEEFCILLPQTNIEEASIVAERLRSAVETKAIETFIEKDDSNKNISVTISIGLSQLKETDMAEDLYKRADKALYEAKETGRNKVVVYYD